ncbi:MAG: PQQ-binding-like beta-propeller repeat protein [Gammaproteobacteria bacterium]|nr:PQQ-binding-like beta-propeller repeat protein [Gammaproteobacteria bacterium]
MPNQINAEQVKHTAIDAAGLYAEKCLLCHARPGPWPDAAGLSKLSTEEVYRVLTAGLMREIANDLNDAERQSIANYVGGLNPDKPSLASGGLCSKDHKDKTHSQAASGNWFGWSVDNGNDRYVRDISLSKSQVSGLKLKWSFVFPDTAPFTSASNQPTVVDGRLYIGNMNSMVYALDANTGCTHWSFKARSHVRSVIAVSGETLVFADYETNVYVLDAQSGAIRWIERADEQPSARVNGNVALHNGVVYVPISSNQEFTVSFRPEASCCSFRGMIVAFDVKTGKKLWKTSLIDEPLQELGPNAKGVMRYGPSGVAVWSVPTIDIKRQLLYVTTANQLTEPRVEESDAVVALDLNTGKKQWVKSLVPAAYQQGDIWNSGCESEMMFNESESHCPPVNVKHEGDREIGAPAVLKTLANGEDALLVGTKDGYLYALNPDSEGELLWQLRLGTLDPGRGPIFGGIEHGIAVDDKYAYVPIADISFVQQTSKGSMARVELETGKLVWQKKAASDTCKDKPFGCNNGYMGAPTVVGNILFAGSADGNLRAFDASNGKIVWSYDTVRQYTGVNGLKGSGGAINRNGPTIANGMLYQTSGYGHLAMGMPGNVLLAFEIPEN